MEISLGAHQAALIAVIITLLIATISLGWGITRLAKSKKRLCEKLANPNALNDALEKTKTLTEKIETGEGLLQKVSQESELFSDKLRYVNAKLYPPVFKYDDGEQLKIEIAQYRNEQLSCILSGNAADAYSNWEWFGSKSDGRAMVAAYKELLISAFNAEFDTIRKQMRASTTSTARSKLIKLREQLERLSETVGCTITSEYFDLKLKELDVWAGEIARKEEEKYRKKEQQQKLRKQNKLSGEGIDVEIVEDQLEFTKSELAAARAQALELAGLADATLNKEIAKLEKQIAATEKKLARATSEAEKTRAGYIYVISNIGSFGEGVVKIGMTRRLEPMERVTELGDASVPFRFDVHTLAFVDDAPSVEKKLHERFDECRVNTDNHRKEFFRTSPQDVQHAMKAMGVESDWYFDIEAREYRETMSILAAQKEVPSVSTTFPEAI